MPMERPPKEWNVEPQGLPNRAKDLIYIFK
jgi:hypothetical protein